MRIIYTPADGEKREWEYDPNDIDSFDAEAIERVTGWTYDEFGEQFMKGSTLAKHAILWVMLRRDNRSLKFHDVRFRLSEFTAQLSADELDKLETVMQEQDLSEEEREQFEEMLSEGRKALERDVEANPTETPSKTVKRKSGTTASEA